MNSLLFLLCFPLSLFAHSNHEAKPGKQLSHSVLTGNGIHTFATVPHWGDLPGGAPLGPTHGGVAVSRTGEVYVSTDSDRGICVFSKEGKFLRSIAPDCSGTHSLAIREEGGVEYLYGAHLKGQRIVKLATNGDLIWEIKDTEANPIPGSFKGLTAVAVAPDGRVYAAVGYGSNRIHIFSQSSERLKTFGAKGKETGQFHTCHGLAIDRRFEDPLLLVVDRENRRLAHYTLDGEFVRVFAENLRRPCAVSFHGKHCAVAELQGRVTLLDASGTPVAFLGDNPDRDQWAKFKTALEDIPAGIFTAPHGLAFDASGNLYVQDWNQTGRITKLERRYPATE